MKSNKSAAVCLRLITLMVLGVAVLGVLSRRPRLKSANMSRC